MCKITTKSKNDFFYCTFWLNQISLWIHLTSKMSATIAQFMFKANWPKNIKIYVERVCFETIKQAPVSKGALSSRPKAHITGSQEGNRFFSACDRYDPRGTPIRPASIVKSPNLNATLEIINVNIEAAENKVSLRFRKRVNIVERITNKEQETRTRTARLCVASEGVKGRGQLQLTLWLTLAEIYKLGIS